MRKLGWFAVSMAVAAVIAAAVLLLAANLYVQSQGAQQRIRQTLTEALHIPVSLKKTTVTPWEGLRLDGIVLHPPVSVGGSPDAGNFLSADSFHIRAAWWPLLTQRRVVVEDVLLDHPRLSWAQDADGRWIWPDNPPSQRHKKPEARPSVVAAVSTPPAPIATAPSPAGILVTTAKNTTDAEVDLGGGVDNGAPIERFRVRHGAFDFLNARDKLLCRFKEIDLDGRLSIAGHVSGDIRFEQATTASVGWQLTHFRSRFNYDENKGLSVYGGRGEFAGGELLANYDLRTQESGSPFSADCRLDNVDLAQLIEEAGSPLRLMEGRLQGSVQFQGYSDDPNRRKAVGQLCLVNAHLTNFPILQLLGEMLRIEDLSHLQFKQAELSCQLDDNDLEITAVQLVSNDLQIYAKGRYATDEDRLAVHGKLVIDQAVSHQLPQFVETNLTPCGEEAPGSRYIEFDVSGPLGNPTTNLFDRLLAGPSNGLLQNLLAPKPRKLRGKGSKTNTPPPSATPAPESGGS